ncbi:MAG: hypothetical protein ABFR53_11185 [Actinomycetota bacterium]
MRRPSLWLIAIAALVIVVVSVTRITDDEPGLASPVDTTSAPGGPTTTAGPVETTSTFAPAPALASGATVCDRYESIRDTGTIESTDLVEASGLAVGRVSPDVLWSHNDSRGGAKLFAFDAAGNDLGAFELPGIFAIDWEDIAAGPGPDGSGNYLYVGDIGDNFAIRSGQITIYRVPDADPADLSGSFAEVVSLPFRYPDGTHNAEAIFVDPIEPAIYVVTKDKAQALIFKGSLLPTGQEVELENVATLFLDAEVSGGDISWDGHVIALRGYQTVWMWNRPTGATVADAFNTDPCTAPAPEERQGEAIVFDGDLGYWTVSEGKAPAIHAIPVEP